MSRHVIGYEGVGKSRRPIYADEGPASAAVGDPVAAIGVLSATQVRGSIAVGGGAGQVERRQATEAQMAAAREREADPIHLTMATLDKPAVFSPRTRATSVQMATSRQRGAERHVEVLAARKAVPRTQPSPEEETVSEPRADHAETISSEAPAVDVGLDRLAMAAEGARTAWDAKAAADTAWGIAREALAAAYAGVEWMVEPLPTPPDDDHVHQVLMVPIAQVAEARAAVAFDGETQVVPAPIGGGPAPRRNAREPRTEGLTTRQSKAIELMQDGKTRADIARAMGTTYQTVDGLFEAAAKKKLLPIELIPLLPARFAKYSGV